MKHSYALCFVLALCLLMACSPVPANEAEPSDPEVTDPPCVVIPRSLSGFGYNTKYEDSTTIGGCYNPANADEVAVLGGSTVETGIPGASLPLPGIYVLNLRTQQKTVVFRGVPGQNVVWSRTGWLAFVYGDEVWKVKANGDSAAQLTSTGRVLSTLDGWSPDGRFLLCHRGAPGYPYAQSGLAIYTARGAFVRLLPDSRVSAGLGSWSPDGRRLAFAGLTFATVRLCLYDLATDQIDTLDVFPRKPGSNTYGLVGGVRWLPNGTEVVWTNHNGVHITNLQTRRSRLVRASCTVSGSGEVPSRTLDFAVPSPDGQRLLVGRSDLALSPTVPNQVLLRYSLETMDLQGGQIHKVTP